MSISDGLGAYFFRRKMEKTRPMREEMDEKMFISRQSQHFSFAVSMIKVFFPVCTLTWRVNNYVSRQGKGMNKGIESTNNIFFVLLKQYSHFVTQLSVFD